MCNPALSPFRQLMAQRIPRMVPTDHEHASTAGLLTASLCRLELKLHRERRDFVDEKRLTLPPRQAPTTAAGVKLPQQRTCSLWT
jgi:hypothetical protein